MILCIIDFGCVIFSVRVKGVMFYTFCFCILNLIEFYNTILRDDDTYK